MSAADVPEQDLGTTPQSTTTSRAFYIQVAVPMRLPDAGRLLVTYRRGYNKFSISIAQHAAVIEPLIPRPPVDIALLRNAFSSMVAKQWEMYLPSATTDAPLSPTHAQSVKARFIAEMYARACYSMLLLSAGGPGLLRVPVRAAAMLPLSRGMAIALGGALLSGLNQLVPHAVHRQLLLSSALMGALDVLLDEAASSGEAAVLRIASLITPRAPTTFLPAEQPIATLTRMIRRSESSWQSGYWETVLVPAVHADCLAQALAVAQAPDPKGMVTAGLELTPRSRACGMWWVPVWGYVAIWRGLKRQNGIVNNSGWLIHRCSC